MARCPSLDTTHTTARGLAEAVACRLKALRWLASLTVLAIGVGAVTYLLLQAEQGDRTVQEQNLCVVSVGGRQIDLPVGKSLNDQGRIISCRNFDGHVVLVYTAQN